MSNPKPEDLIIQAMAEALRNMCVTEAMANGQTRPEALQRAADIFGKAAHSAELELAQLEAANAATQ